MAFERLSPRELANLEIWARSDQRVRDAIPQLLLRLLDSYHAYVALAEHRDPTNLIQAVVKSGFTTVFDPLHEYRPTLSCRMCLELNGLHRADCIAFTAPTMIPPSTRVKGRVSIGKGMKGVLSHYLASVKPDGKEMGELWWPGNLERE